MDEQKFNDAFFEMDVDHCAGLLSMAQADPDETDLDWDEIRKLYSEKVITAAKLRVGMI